MTDNKAGDASMVRDLTILESAPGSGASTLEWALFHASLGFRVFRLHANGKTPIEEGWTLNATRDPDTIARWWEGKDHNIGLLMGEAWVALDFDCKPKLNPDGTPKLDENGEQVVGRGLDALFAFDVLDDLPNGYRQKTTSGGKHVILRLPEGAKVRSSAHKLRPDVDVRGHNGYVVGAGSTIDGKPYKWLGGTEDEMPNKFVTWCGKPRERAEDSQTPLVELDQPRNVERAIRYLRDVATEAVVGAGANDRIYLTACEVKDCGISRDMCIALLGEHYNEAGKIIPMIDHEELADIVSNAYAYGASPPGIADPAVEFTPSEYLDEPELADGEMPAWPTAFKPFDPAKLERRQWLYAKHYARKFVSATIAPGGAGKSSLGLAEAIAMATGRPILGHLPPKRVRVWYWGGEDPIDELMRRVAALCALHDVPMEELEGWLFLDSGRKLELMLAVGDRGSVVLNPRIIDELKRHFTACQIDVAIIDPFVSSHRVPENDNGAIDLVVKAWAGIADAVNCAIELIHHTSKTRGDEVTADHARGASALVNAARAVRGLNVMTKADAEALGVPEDHRRSCVRIDSVKANLAPAGVAEWVKLTDVTIGNGEHIGAVRSWQVPQAVDKVTPARIAEVQRLMGDREWRASNQSDRWLGYAIAPIFGVDMSAPGSRAEMGRLLAVMVSQDAIRKTRGAVPGQTGRDRPLYIVGDVDPLFETDESTPDDTPAVTSF